MKKEELTEKYFLGDLTAEESEQFHALLEENEAFKEQFEFEKSVRKVVRTAEKAKLKNKLQEWEQDLQQSAGPKWFNRPAWRIAASIAVLISVGLYFYYASNFTTDTGALYALHYEKYPNTVYTITRGDAQEESMERRAFTAYEANDYSSAIQLFTSLKAEKQEVYIDFYLAQSYLEDNQIEKAIASFKEVIAHNADFAGEARWYLALAYLKNEEKEKAMQQLEDIASGNDYKQEESGELLEKLK